MCCTTMSMLCICRSLAAGSTKLWHHSCLHLLCHACSIMEASMVKESCVQVSVDVNITSVADNSTSLIPAGTYLDPRDDSDTIDVINAINSDWLDDQCTPNSGLAVFYFCSFMLFCAYLLQQLIIAILLDNIQTTSIMDSLVITGVSVRAGWQSG